MEVLDKVIAEKILPKIRGDESIQLLIESLASLIKEKIGGQSKSFQELNRMKKELDRYGATHFWR